MKINIYDDIANCSNVLYQNKIEIPFYSHHVMHSIIKYLKDNLLLFTLEQNHIQIAQALFFTTESDGLKIAYSRGRFGMAGLRIYSTFEEYQFKEFIRFIEEYFKNNNYASMSITEEPITKNLELSKYFENHYYITNGTIYLNNVINFFNNSGNVILKDYNKRSNLSRNLKKGKNLGYQVYYSTQLDKMSEWYKQCHLPRIKELNGNQWEYDIFKTLIDSGTGLLYYVVNLEGDIVGGCFCLLTKNVNELFMMSTTTQYLQEGVNYLLTDEIFKNAYQRGIQFINWQASNPPTGGVAKFKMSWGAIPKSFKTYTKLFDLSLMEKDKDFFNKNFPNRYVIPFELLEHK